MSEDPWSVQQSENNTNGDVSLQEINTDTSLCFEDSFIADNNNSHPVEKPNKPLEPHQPLPDSESYLKGLERKLEKLKKNSKLVDALSEKRDDCLRSLVENDIGVSHCNELLLELDTSVNSDSTVNNLFRQIQPVQPQTIGETVHIVNYDQLEEQRLELETAEDTGSEEDLPASR